MTARTLLVCLLAACAPAAPSREPPRYPTRPAATSRAPSAHAPTFEAAPELVTTTFACRAEERSPANALDDDCDGNIDGDTSDGLLLAIAYPRSAALELALQTADQPAPQPVDAAPCPERAPFCTTHLRSETLAPGKYTLVARSTDTSAASLPSSLLVSVQSQGKVSAYLLRIERVDEVATVGWLAIP